MFPQIAVRTFHVNVPAYRDSWAYLEKRRRAGLRVPNGSSFKRIVKIAALTAVHNCCLVIQFWQAST
jgi:hypothetical protein